MPSLPRRFRIEGSSGARPGSSPFAAPPVPAAAAERGSDYDELARELHAMRSAISTTKREVADLQRSPSGTEGMHRAASELDAVSAATEEATTAILGAVEDIELAANMLKGGAEAVAGDAAGAILDRVLVLYEACNFQDITGQRIRKVVTTLKFVEERLDRVIAAWNQLPAGSRAQVEPPAPVLLVSGPGLPGDTGRVSQQDVDAFFA